MSKTKFTGDEYDQILKLVRQKVDADRDTQKKLRKKIRNIGFRWSELSPTRSGFNVLGVENLLRMGIISVEGEAKAKRQGTINKVASVKVTRTTKTSGSSKTQEKIELKSDPFANSVYSQQSDLDSEVLSNTGLYSFRLVYHAKLPERYQRRLDERPYRIIYIGKAQGQTLEKRLGQELQHTSPGTFFRSIGAVLGYRPVKGSLRNASNKKNYKFSEEDTREVVNWLRENIEVCITPHSGDFSIENQIISKYTPLLNHAGNPWKCQELVEDRMICRAVAAE